MAFFSSDWVNKAPIQGAIYGPPPQVPGRNFGPPPIGGQGHHLGPPPRAPKTGFTIGTPPGYPGGPSSGTQQSGTSVESTSYIPPVRSDPGEETQRRLQDIYNQRQAKRQALLNMMNNYGG